MSADCPAPAGSGCRKRLRYCADAGADQQHGRVVRTGADDHLAGFDHLASDEFDPDCGAAAHEHPLHVRVAADRQVGAIARGVQVAEGRAHTTAVDGIDRKGTDAHRTWRVVVGDQRQTGGLQRGGACRREQRLFSACVAAYRGGTTVAVVGLGAEVEVVFEPNECG